MLQLHTVLYAVCCARLRKCNVRLEFEATKQSDHGVCWSVSTLKCVVCVFGMMNLELVRDESAGSSGFQL